jgi:hypothetical protein
MAVIVFRPRSNPSPDPERNPKSNRTSSVKLWVPLVLIFAVIVWLLMSLSDLFHP